MDYNKVMDEIGKIVNDYCKAKNPTPVQIMEWYRRLSGYLWHYATFVADVKAEYNSKYFIRKIETVKEKDRLVKANLAVNKAEIEAMLSTETQFFIEMEAESLAYKTDLLLRQGNKVCEAMKSHISLLKKEMEQSNDN